MIPSERVLAEMYGVSRLPSAQPSMNL
ncbi:MAG: hypothetical protein V8R46_09180 [Eubacterium ramulus]